MLNNERPRLQFFGLVSEVVKDNPLAERIDERIDFLETGVGKVNSIVNAGELLRLLIRIRAQDLIKPLEGPDNGLYLDLVTLSQDLGVKVEDNDERTKDILVNGIEGLHKQFASGWANLVKQGSPLAMAARLAHEQAHHFTPSIANMDDYILSESMAEGVAFIVCDHFGLDISGRAFPYIAAYNRGIFTPRMRRGIRNISLCMTKGIYDIRKNNSS